ncbi:adenosine deaminase [Kushneria sinocarnis]|uniref:Adenine deaminase n=1 Tax=Kushneria sinocarnis TaxID=595502 RepID=A0A420WX40_9GAMM|nr:adenosine deaminase [Kushneria sinocarnis]RKR04295.1 adenosine deaminase [Kushneria sinocarnis]
MNTWLKALPKAELHLHIEGTLEPEQMFELAARNGVTLPYASVDEVRAAYEFSDLQSFLDLYYQGMTVLHTEQDFFELAMAYFARAHDDGVVHVELSFDPQPHLARGVALGVPFEGLERAMREAERRYDISSALIMSFVRDRPADEALDVLEQAQPWHHQLAAIGLDSAEVGNPPEKFTAVFERARELGIPRLAHAGEEGPAGYISGALDALDVCRIDHGVRCLEDAALVERLRSKRMPLTVCPLSNVYLRVVERLEDHPLPMLLEQGLKVTLNSDDPAYFGGGMLNNFIACHAAFGWEQAIFRQLARHALEEAFMDDERRSRLLSAVASC